MVLVPNIHTHIPRGVTMLHAVLCSFALFSAAPNPHVSLAAPIHCDLWQQLGTLDQV